MKSKKTKSTIGWLYEFAKPHKKHYIISIIMAILGVICSIIPYFGIAKIIFNLIDKNKDFGSYITILLLMACAWILRVVFHSISTTLSHKATFKTISEIRYKLTKKLTQLPMGYLVNTPSGQLKNTIIEKTDSIEPSLAHVLPETTSNLLIPIGIVVYIFTIDWRMALISLITLPLGMIFFEMMKKGYEEKYANYLNKNKILNSVAVEYIKGIEVIKTFNQSANSYKKFTRATKEAADSSILWMKDCQVYFSLAYAIFPAVLITVLPFGCYFFMNETLTAQNFILIIILSVGIMPPLITSFSYYDDIAKIGTIVNDITDILTEKNLVRPSKNVKLSKYDISLNKVNFGYDDKDVLKNINLKITNGEQTALVGASGSGKSTIAKLIASLWDVGSGSIEIGGINIKNIPMEQINNLIAYVSQDNYLFDNTIRENIRMGNNKATDEEVEKVAKESGCHEFIMQLEDGYDTQVGSAGGHLSGGESQRIAIARAMLKDAPIIILDEATSFTDPENEAVIQNAVAKLIKNKTLIVIAHRLSTIIYSDKIVVLDDGKIEAQGTHEQLLSTSKLYNNMWNAHIQSKDNKEA